MNEDIKTFLDNPENKKKMIVGGAIGLALIVMIVVWVVIDHKRNPLHLYIDTTQVSMAERVKSIELDAPYYNKKVRSKTLRFYEITENKTKWLEYRKPKSNYSTFVSAVKEAASYGLNPDHYDLKNIEESVAALYDNRERTHDDVASLDVRITASAFLFTTHLIEGRIRTAGYGEFIWKKNPPHEDDVELLANNSSGRLGDVIEKLHSEHDQYEKLRKALADYRKLESEWKFEKTSSSNQVLKPGMKSSLIPKIRYRVSLTDLESYDPEDSLVYDDKLADAVEIFQRRHGLEPDRIISGETLRQLNKSFGEKADLIELNLERVRWLPAPCENCIVVNVPEYMLRVYKNKKVEMEMRVVLGSAYNATPIFSDTLEYIVFSPTWSVPKSILGEEMVPKLQENATAYDPERFQFFQDGKEIHPEDIDWKDKDLDTSKIRVVEKPGDKNALGLVKFIMPNDFSIYLHDTPAQAHFNENNRALSHGCVRLEKPVDLAEYLLRDQDDWNREKINEAMAGTEPITVHLEEHIPVQIDYRTVWVDDDGLVNFREDVYGHDKRQMRALKRLEKM